jgi:hypothetical protein
MAGNGNHHMRSFAERARSVLSDDRLKQAGAVTEDVAARAEEASKTVTRKSCPRERMG